MNNESIILRGVWKPTREEVGKLREYKSKRPLKYKTLYLPGRQPRVSFILCGREPVSEVKAGEWYFVVIRPDTLHNGTTVRRVVRVYPWDLAVPGDAPEVTLDYLVRPITVLEAWRASRGPVSLVRTYKKSRGSDRVLVSMDNGSFFEAEMFREEDDDKMKGALLHWETIQKVIDELDTRTRDDVLRPDWDLVHPARR